MRRLYSRGFHNRPLKDLGASSDHHIHTLNMVNKNQNSSFFAFHLIPSVFVLFDSGKLSKFVSNSCSFGVPRHLVHLKVICVEPFLFQKSLKHTVKTVRRGCIGIRVKFRQLARSIPFSAQKLWNSEFVFSIPQIPNILSYGRLFTENIVHLVRHINEI